MLDFIATVIEPGEKLVKLQALDLERSRLAQAARALPAEMAEGRAVLDKAQRDATAASSALTREENLRTKLEREIAGHKQKAQRYQAQRDSVTNAEQAEAIEHEIGFAEKDIERLENEELESLERTDEQEAVLARAREQVEQAAAALEATRERVKARQREIAELQAKVEGEREELRKLIDEDWLVRFDRIAAHRGTAMARAENQQCTSCRMGIRPQVWNQVREGEMPTCDSCKRLLYWDSTMIAKPPEPEPARNAAPPAVPKPRRVS
jgi:predicted  nucleic acid-binding Zn-ribbon protein